MKIDFYEEFPTKENLEKLRLIKFPIRLFVAAKSIKEFKELEKQIKKIKRGVKVTYWPIIPNSYWISPFSNTKDLIKMFGELKKINNQILIDLEPPLKNKKLMAKNILWFFKNKKLIKNFLRENKERIIIAERSRVIFSKRIEILMKVLGFSYNFGKKNPMFYTSMLNKKQIKKCKKFLSKMKNKKDYTIGIGVIAIGILGNEPILPPENLEKDLKFVKDAGFDKVIIFRLGGLNKNYIKVINKFDTP